MVRTRNPLNIGAGARAMSNFGFPHLRVVNPYEPAFREARSAVGASSLLASAGDLERITALLLETLYASGYLTPNAKSTSEAKIRRLVRRLNLPAADTELWQGIFRQIAWKTNNPTQSAD